MTKFCKISTIELSYVVPVKSTVEILQNFMASSEYTNSIFYILKVEAKQPQLKLVAFNEVLKLEGKKKYMLEKSSAKA